ncbi:DUF2061 domain-containing protein [Roseibium sp.]|uniref:DUF2061 domain-containing protein n=1 Tax=Roseibium sp. TaxID=1936156 RepID=UPI003A96A97B
METARRTLVKSITWQLMGIVTMTLLSYPHTRSLVEAMSLAASASLTGFFCFFLHERIWSRVRWGRQG